MTNTCVTCAVLLLCITTNAQIELSTSFNGAAWLEPPGGNMFDVKNIGLTELTIKRFGVHVQAINFENWDVTIYTKSGTYVGYEFNSATWTTIHQESRVGGAGNWAETLLSNLQSTVSIASMDIQAFFIFITNVRFYYDTSSEPTPGTLLASDNNLAIYEGNACSGFAGVEWNPRKWNGVIYYSLSTPAPTTTMPTSNNPTTNMPSTAIPTTTMPTTTAPSTTVPTTTVPTTAVPTTAAPTTAVPTTNIPTNIPTDVPTSTPTVRPTINDNGHEVFETTVSGNQSGDFTQVTESKNKYLWLLFVSIGCVICMVVIVSFVYVKKRRNKLGNGTNIEMCVGSDSQHETNPSPQSAISTERLNSVSTTLQITANTAPDTMGNIQMKTDFNEDDDDGLYTTNVNVEHETVGNIVTKGNNRTDTGGEGDTDGEHSDDQLYLNSTIQTNENNATNTGGLNITEDKLGVTPFDDIYTKKN